MKTNIPGRGSITRRVRSNRKHEEIGASPPSGDYRTRFLQRSSVPERRISPRLLHP